MGEKTGFRVQDYYKDQYNNLHVCNLLIIETEPQQCEEEVREENDVPVSEGGGEECRQNGDGGHEAPLEEGETKPEEEHNSNRSADSPSEGQQ